MIPSKLKDLARRKSDDDSRDRWIDCPECESGNAVVISENYQTYTVCPDCGSWEWIDGE